MYQEICKLAPHLDLPEYGDLAPAQSTLVDLPLPLFRKTVCYSWRDELKEHNAVLSHLMNARHMLKIDKRLRETCWELQLKRKLSWALDRDI